MKSRKAPRCMLGVVVIALFLAITWSAPTAQLSTSNYSPEPDAGAVASSAAARATTGAIVIDAAPNMSLEVLPKLALSAAAMSPFAPPKANLDQTRNGTASAPVDPPNWVNGNAGASQAHYNEGHSIPYRAVMTDLAAGTHFIEIEWDIRHSSKNAIDYITHVQRLNPHLFIPPHPAETVDPKIGVAGVSEASSTLFAIPAPNAGAPTVATNSFNALPAGERQMKIYNGTITGLTYVSEGNLAAAQSATRLKIDFNAPAGGTVVVTWGGHIASSLDWGEGNAASGVSGSPYHTRLISLDGASTGNQDRSLSAAAVVTPPACTITGPTPVCPGSTNSYSGPAGSGLTYSWTISGNGTFAGGGTTATGTPVSVVAGNGCADYTLTLTVTRTSDGGSTTCSKTVDVDDSQAPTVTFCPGNATISCPATPFFGTPTFSDNCDANLTVTPTNSTTPGCGGNTGTFTRVWTATDDCGNSVTCSQTITVVDNTPPSIGSPGASTTIQCPTEPVFTPPTATDACDSTPSIIEVSDVTEPGGCAGTYTRTKTWRAVDDCGNPSETVSQTITVADTTAPSIGAPGASSTIECPAEPVFTPPTATDTCDPNPSVVEVSDVTTPGTCSGSYTRRKTWKAVDACGNQSNQVTQTITVSDTTAPTIGAPGAPATIECPATPSFTPPTATDTCDPNPTIVEVSDVTIPGPCPGVYTRTKTWKAKDCSNNESGTVSQTITVEDTTAPVLSGCPTETEITVDCLDDVRPPPEVTALDACQGTIAVNLDQSSSNVNDCGENCGGVITRIWTATDCSGNSSSCMQVITYGVPAPDLSPIAALLSTGDVVVGIPGTRSLTIPGGIKAGASARCFVTKLAVGGPATALPDFGDAQLSTATCRTSGGVELRNALLNQAISLALNLRLSTRQENIRAQARSSGAALTQLVGRPDIDFDLGTFRLTSTFWTQGALSGQDGARGTLDDELDMTSARLQFVIPASVLSALKPNATAADLLKLANAALAGHSTGDVSLSDISAALDAVNRGFDLGKRRLMVGPSQR